MARRPVSEEELVARFGPHLNEAPPAAGTPVWRSTGWWRRTAASAGSSGSGST
jgi:hypothetical protein